MENLSRKSVLFIISEASLLFDVLDESNTGALDKQTFIRVSQSNR